jgi:hypothetical protein
MSLWRRRWQLNHLCWNLLNIGVLLLLLYHLWLWLSCLGLNLLTCLMWPLLLWLNVELWCLTSYLRYLNYCLWLRLLVKWLHRLSGRLEGLGLSVLYMTLALHTVHGCLVRTLRVLLGAQRDWHQLL